MDGSPWFDHRRPVRPAPHPARRHRRQRHDRPGLPRPRRRAAVVQPQRQRLERAARARRSRSPPATSVRSRSPTCSATAPPAWSGRRPARRRAPPAALPRPDGRQQAAPADRDAQQPRRGDDASTTRRRPSSTCATRPPARRGSPGCRSRCTASRRSPSPTCSRKTVFATPTATTTATSTASSASSAASAASSSSTRSASTTVAAANVDSPLRHRRTTRSISRRSRPSPGSTPASPPIARASWALRARVLPGALRRPACRQRGFAERELPQPEIETAARARGRRVARGDARLQGHGAAPGGVSSSTSTRCTSAASTCRCGSSPPRSTIAISGACSRAGRITRRVPGHRERGRHLSLRAGARRHRRRWSPTRASPTR